MVKKTIFMFLIFLAGLMYINQRVNIYIEAYKLNTSCHKCDKLIDVRDALLYNFSKRVSLAKINSWVEANNFHLAQGNQILSLYINNNQNAVGFASRPAGKTKTNILAASFRRVFRFLGVSKALAQEQR